jgi:phage gpG-like protein
MKVKVLVFRDEIIAEKFDRMGFDALNAKPAFKDVAKYMMEVTDTVFESQGRRGGGSWRRNTAKWTAYKAKKGWDLRILHARYPRSNTLRKSVTRPRAGGQILVIEDDFMQLGSSLPYAARHQYGHGKTPARPYLKFTKRDTTHIRDMIRDHLMRAWSKRQ